MCFYCFCILLSLYRCQILYEEAFIDDNFIDSQGWTVNNRIESIGYCNEVKLFGGYGVFGKNTRVTKLFQLPPHHSIQLRLEFWKIDSWDDEKFYIYLDQNEVFSQMFGASSTNSNLCGNEATGIVWREEIHQINIIKNHNFKSLLILLTSNLNGQLDEWWGIRQFRLYIYPCPNGCQTCTSDDSAIDCLIWLKYYESLVNLNYNDFQQEGWIIDQSLQSISQCSNIPIIGDKNIIGRDSRLTKSINLPIHCLVKIKFRFLFIDKWNSEYAQLYVDNELIWNYSHQTLTNITNICGNSFGEVAYNLEIILPHKRQQLLLQFTTTLQKQQSQQSYGIRDLELFIYVPNGFPQDLGCGIICGNGQIEGQEQCDDGNIYPFDGCFNCQYQCVEGCINCIEGICYNCQQGWILNIIDSLCIPICGDNIINGFEECDNNQNQLDQYLQCDQCQFKCQQECINCQFGKCLECDEGMIINDYICQINQNEHNQLTDGKCQDNCQLCTNYICEYCEYGFQMINNQCQTVCGDGILAGNEICELEQQQCINCLYICSENCNYCFDNGICHQCFFGYELDLNRLNCYSICGDGIVSNDEECDDFNQDNGDGCSNKCQIENNYICRNLQYSFTQCIYEKYPSFKLSLINSSLQIQYVSIYFDQMVKTNTQCDFSEQIHIHVIDLNQTFYQFQLIPIQQPFQNVSFVQYLIEIQFNTTLLSPPILEVILNNQLYNQNNAPLINLINQIKLHNPSYINHQQESYANHLNNVAKYSIITMGGLGIFQFLLCETFLLSETLEILQQQSYLKFINVIFPFNLFIYFESSNLITIQPILDMIQVDNLLSQIFAERYLESYEKLLSYRVNADILINIQTQVILFLALIVTYYSNIFILKLFRNIPYSCLFIFGQTFAKALVKIMKKVLKFKRKFESEIIQSFLHTNSWDLLFMSFLYIQTQTNHIFSNLVAYLILYSTLLLSTKIFERIHHQSKRQQQFWISKYDQMRLIKKIFFIWVLVMFQENQNLQIMLLTLICQFYLVYLFVIKPFKNNLDYINTLALEISSFIFCFSSSFYWNNFIIKFNNENQINLAWFQIGMLLSCLFINLMSQLWMISVQLKSKIAKLNKKYTSKKTQKQIKSNPFLIV
ncbi:unnamed protein product [Paramecium sonneborni]|uniref:Uncharacterized protein n=1 Tax=Paramecium sonneborni TaxID=65129 RepID=A0A8S1LPI6_9CILI|nr:unnamed protein product [Paramecium sonneborni]